ncbi:hypothetical protein KA977_06685 [Candidatus Dependentiae bacterium]|nr:hypothetical protein [Candidatus Dependentiae bacterium]
MLNTTHSNNIISLESLIFQHNQIKKADMTGYEKLDNILTNIEKSDLYIYRRNWFI